VQNSVARLLVDFCKTFGGLLVKEKEKILQQRKARKSRTLQRVVRMGHFWRRFFSGGKMVFRNKWDGQSKGKLTLVTG